MRFCQKCSRFQVLSEVRCSRQARANHLLCFAWRAPPAKICSDLLFSHLFQFDSTRRTCSKQLAAQMARRRAAQLGAAVAGEAAVAGLIEPEPLPPRRRGAAAPTSPVAAPVAVQPVPVQLPAGVAAGCQPGSGDPFDPALLSPDLRWLCRAWALEDALAAAHPAGTAAPGFGDFAAALLGPLPQGSIATAAAAAGMVAPGAQALQVQAQATRATLDARAAVAWADEAAREATQAAVRARDAVSAAATAQHSAAAGAPTWPALLECVWSAAAAGAPGVAAFVPVQEQMQLKLHDAAPRAVPPALAPALAEAPCWAAPPIALEGSVRPGCTLLTIDALLPVIEMRRSAALTAALSLSSDEAATSEGASAMPAEPEAAAVARALLRSEAGPALREQRWSVMLPGSGGCAHVAVGGKVTSEAVVGPPTPRLPPLRPLALHVSSDAAEARVVRCVDAPAPGCAGAVLCRLHGQNVERMAVYPPPTDADGTRSRSSLKAAPGRQLGVRLPEGLDSEGVALFSVAYAGYGPGEARARPVLLTRDAAIAAEVAQLAAEVDAAPPASKEQAEEAAEALVACVGHALRPGAPIEVLMPAAEAAMRRGWTATSARLLTALRATLLGEADCPVGPEGSMSGRRRTAAAAAAAAGDEAGPPTLLHAACCAGVAASKLVPLTLMLGGPERLFGSPCARGPGGVTPLHLAATLADGAAAQALADDSPMATLAWFCSRAEVAGGATPAALAVRGGAGPAALHARLLGSLSEAQQLARGFLDAAAEEAADEAADEDAAKEAALRRAMRRLSDAQKARDTAAAPSTAALARCVLAVAARAASDAPRMAAAAATAAAERAAAQKEAQSVVERGPATLFRLHGVKAALAALLCAAALLASPLAVALLAVALAAAHKATARE